MDHKHRLPAWRWIALAQGVYYLTTGMWPIIHMDSFLAVTGPKTDLWLVQFFGALVCVLAMILISMHHFPNMQGLIAAMASAAILMVGEVICVWRGSIGPVYLLDALLELLFLIAWGVWLYGSSSPLVVAEDRRADG